MDQNEATNIVARQLAKHSGVKAWTLWALYGDDTGKSIICELETGETLSVTVEILAQP